MNELRRYDLIPPIVWEALATVIGWGALKHGEGSWKRIASDTMCDQSWAAMMRHGVAMRGGVMFDPESHLPHSWHMLCRAAFIVYHEWKQREGQKGKNI